MKTVARHFLIRGRVQGVGFRWFVINAAEERGLAGWTRNLPDGAVEVVAQGAAAALESFAGVIQVGPSAARVTAMESEDVAVVPDLEAFHVRY